jgi:ankyrin repeat protein
MSNFVFDDGNVGVIFATMQLYAVSAADMNPYLMFTRINQADNEGVGPVYVAAQNGHSDILKLLIKAGGDVNQLIEGGISPLMTASAKGHVECVKILLAAGANALHKSDAGITALDAAIHNKHTAVIAILRAHLEAKTKAEAEVANQALG